MDLTTNEEIEDHVGITDDQWNEYRKVQPNAADSRTR